MNFDQPIDRRGSHSVKWDMMERIYGVPADTGLAMWVADMEFHPPACVQQAVEKMAAHGVYGYFGDDTAYLDAIRWWMQTRHGWDVDAGAIFTTHGLVNAFGICLEACTAPGDGIAGLSCLRAGHQSRRPDPGRMQASDARRKLPDGFCRLGPPDDRA
jgi:cystathionine beta-lyase